MANEMAFISQPMSGLTENEILAIRDKAKRYLESHGYQVIDSYNPAPSGAKHDAAGCLARSLTLMAEADIVYFVKGWETARGCRIEERVAHDYGITCMYQY